MERMLERKESNAKGLSHHSITRFKSISLRNTKHWNDYSVSFFQRFQKKCVAFQYLEWLCRICLMFWDKLRVFLPISRWAMDFNTRLNKQAHDYDVTSRSTRDIKNSDCVLVYRIRLAWFSTHFPRWFHRARSVLVEKRHNWRRRAMEMLASTKEKNDEGDHSRWYHNMEVSCMLRVWEAACCGCDTLVWREIACGGCPTLLWRDTTRWMERPAFWVCLGFTVCGGTWCGLTARALALSTDRPSLMAPVKSLSTAVCAAKG